MHRWSTAAIRMLIAASFCTGPALAQQTLPTDIELHAAYCMTILKWKVSMIPPSELDTPNEPPEMRQQMHDIDQKLLKLRSELQSALDRIKLYIMPRVPYRDPMPLMAATKRAEKDIQDLENEPAQCSQQCGRYYPNQEQLHACLGSCFDHDLEARMDACSNPTWLPF